MAAICTKHALELVRVTWHCFHHVAECDSHMQSDVAAMRIELQLKRLMIIRHCLHLVTFVYIMWMSMAS